MLRAHHPQIAEYPLMITGLFAVKGLWLLKMRRLRSGTVVAQTAVGGSAFEPVETMKIECILCPTDLSPNSDEALRYAIALTRAYNAELILLHCDVTDAGLKAPDGLDEAAQ